MIEVRFTVLRHLGGGSYGIVEEVQIAERRVARKRLKDDLRGVKKYRERFRREIAIMQQLQHPNIMSILEAKLAGDDPWFTMPVADRNLTIELGSADGLPLDRIRSVFDQILDAVEYAHRNGVLHRDLSPRNILLFGDRVVVSDFGLGRQVEALHQLTSFGEKVGTPGYTAPEQWADLHAATELSDIFALGSLLYAMATGRDPLALVSITIPGRFRHIVRRCRHEDPARRYPTVAALRRDFDAVWNSGIDAKPPRTQIDSLIDDHELDVQGVESLVNLYFQHVEDKLLYRETIPRWPDGLLVKLIDRDPNALAEIIVAYDGHLDEALPFEYVDIASDFLARVYRFSDDETLRRLVLERILVMGERHNRFHARRVFLKLAEAAQTAPEILIVRGVLFAHPTLVAWAAEGMQGRNVSTLIREAITAITGGLPLALPAHAAPLKLSRPNPTEKHVPKQNVFHPKFGRGAVVDVADQGNDQIVVVDFHQHGRKHLLASFANLKILAS